MSEETGILSTWALTKSGLSRVLFSIYTVPNTPRDRKRRKVKRLIARPLRNFILDLQYRLKPDFETI
ncbi:hypothetical protein ES703_37156 [subsurface metagenome]